MRPSMDKRMEADEAVRGFTNDEKRIGTVGTERITWAIHWQKRSVDC